MATAEAWVDGLVEGLRNSAVVLAVAALLAGGLYVLRSDAPVDEEGDQPTAEAIPPEPAPLVPDAEAAAQVAAWDGGELPRTPAIVVALGASLADGCDEGRAAALLERVAEHRPSERGAEALAAAALGAWRSGGRCGDLALEVVEALARTEALGPGTRSRLAWAALEGDPPDGHRLVALVDSGAPENPTWADRLLAVAVEDGRKPATRRAACRALARRRLDRPELRAAATDAAVGVCVLRASRQWGDEGPARAALATEHRELRIAAADTLRRMAEPEAVQPLLEPLLTTAVGAREEAARVRAAGYLLRTNPSRAEELLAALPGWEERPWAEALQAAREETVDAPAPRCDAWLEPGPLAAAVASATAALGPAPRLCLRPGVYAEDLRLVDPGIALWAPEGPARLDGELLVAQPAAVVGLQPARLVVDPGAEGSVLLSLGDGERDVGAAVVADGGLRSGALLRRLPPGPPVRRDGGAWVRPAQLVVAPRAGEAGPALDDAPLALPDRWPAARPPGEVDDWWPLLGEAEPGGLAWVLPLLPGPPEPGGPAFVLAP